MGETLLRKPVDQFDVEHGCFICDPSSREWKLGHEIVKVTPEEMQRRFSTLFQQANRSIQ